MNVKQLECVKFSESVCEINLQQGQLVIVKDKDGNPIGITYVYDPYHLNFND